MFAVSEDKYRAIVWLREIDNVRLRRATIKTKLKNKKPSKGKGHAAIGKVNEIAWEKNKRKTITLEIL